MEGQLVDIEYENGTTKLVRIVKDEPEHFIVTPLIQTSGGLFRFSSHPHIAPKESVSGFYDTKELDDTGIYKKIDNIYYEYIETSDSDCDYEYDSEFDYDSESEVSLDAE